MSLSDRIHDFIILLIVALLPLIATGEPSGLPVHPVEVHLQGEVSVGAEQVVLGDVAMIYAKNLDDFKKLAALMISRIPDDKAEVRLPSSYLEARIKAALPPGVQFALHAPGEVVFRLQRLGFGRAEFASEVARLARSFGKIPETAELEVVPLSGLEPLKSLSLNQVRIEPQAEMPRWKGEMSFKVTRSDADEAAPIWIRAKLRWFQNAWVASRQIGFSEQLSPDQLRQARIETTNLREDPFQVSAEELPLLLKGARLKRVIPANAPLVQSALERRPDAMAGAPLKVIFLSESGVSVSTEGNLVAPGSIGESVKARLRSSKKIITGKLVSQSLVEVSL